MAPESPLDATHSPEHAGPVWRDRGTIIANQQARIAELELACQRLRDDYQGALAERDEARAEVEGLRGPFRCCPHCKDDAVHDVEPNQHEVSCQLCDDRLARRAEADAAGLRARIEALADEHWLNPVNYRDPVASVLRTIQTRLRALAAEPAPAAEPHAEDGA